VAKKTSFKFEEVCKPNPEFGGFVCHTLRLVTSEAWKQRGKDVNVARLIDFLETEHLQHAGQANGNLGATYDQLEAFGIQRKNIKGAIAKAHGLGLAIPKASRDPATGRLTITRFRLTYLAFHENGYWQAPLDEWRRYWAPEKIQKPSGGCTTVTVVDVPLGQEQKRRKSAKVQVVDVPLGSKVPISPQITSNTAKFEEPRAAQSPSGGCTTPFYIYDGSADCSRAINTVSFMANGKRIRATSPFQLSTSQDNRGFVLTVVASPPMVRKAA